MCATMGICSSPPASCKASMHSLHEDTPKHFSWPHAVLLQAHGPAACVHAKNGGEVEVLGGSYRLPCDSPTATAIVVAQSSSVMEPAPIIVVEGVTVDA